LFFDSLLAVFREAVSYTLVSFLEGVGSTGMRQGDKRDTDAAFDVAS
jgi:hypothetical protein